MCVYIYCLNVYKRGIRRARARTQLSLREALRKARLLKCRVRESFILTRWNDRAGLSSSNSVNSRWKLEGTEVRAKGSAAAAATTAAASTANRRIVRPPRALAHVDRSFHISSGEL